MVPLDLLYNALSSWKPKTFWEMRYPGYGSVDVVALYGFYFAVIFGIITVIGFGLTAVQTYAGLKQIS